MMRCRVFVLYDMMLLILSKETIVTLVLAVEIFLTEVCQSFSKLHLN